MKNNLIVSTTLVLGTLLAGASFAQTPAPAAAPAASLHLTCKDGTSVDVASTRGACKGHGGIQKDAAAKTAAAAPAATPAAAPAPAAKPAPAAAPAAAATPTAAPAKAAKTSVASNPVAPGGGPGLVWLNDSSKVYHCPTDPVYGKTKKGEYLSEADAKAKGGHASHGKACQ